MAYINISVDLDEVYDQMNHREKQNMVEWMYDDGILDSHPNINIRKLVRGEEELPGEAEIRNNLTKIWNGTHRLTNEEEQLIKQIADKL